MSSQETLVPKKKRGPKPTGQGVQIQVRMAPELVEKLDQWRTTYAEQTGRAITRPEAIRSALESTLGASKK